MENNGTAAEPPVMQEAVSAKRGGFLVRVRTVITTWFGGGVTVVTERTSTEMAQIRTDLAEDRTLMAADRTLMAWIRTALSMYSFGFTIYKLLEGFQVAGHALRHGHTPRNIGLFLVGMGTFAMDLGPPPC